MPSPVEMVLSVVQQLVDHPDRVSARWVESNDGNYVEVKVSPDDRGKLIGKGGRNIQSLRRLTTAAFGKESERIGVEIAE